MKYAYATSKSRIKPIFKIPSNVKKLLKCDTSNTFNNMSGLRGSGDGELGLRTQDINEIG